MTGLSGIELLAICAFAAITLLAWVDVFLGTGDDTLSEDAECDEPIVSPTADNFISAAPARGPGFLSQPFPGSPRSFAPFHASEIPNV